MELKTCIECGEKLKIGLQKYCTDCLKKKLYNSDGEINYSAYRTLKARGVKLGVTKKCCVCGATLDLYNHVKCTDCLLDDACAEAKICRTSHRMNSLYSMLKKRGYDKQTVDAIIAEEVGA